MRWELYPLVFKNEHARALLEMEELLLHSEKVIEANGDAVLLLKACQCGRWWST